MILRDLFRDGECTFNSFHAQARGFSPTTVSKRLKELEKNEFIQAKLYQRNPPRFAYSLTQKGRSLGPVLKAMKAWGNFAIDAQKK